MDVENVSDMDEMDPDMDDFVEGDFDDEVGGEGARENYADEIATLTSAIGTIDETSANCNAKPFSRGEHCHKAIARLEYLLRSEYIRNRRIKDDDDDDDTDNNEIFAKCGEFMLFTKKLIPCFKSLMEDIITHGIAADISKTWLQTTQRLIKMFTRFTFALSHDINNKSDYYIKQNKYHQFAEYQSVFKKALIDDTVLYHILILISHCGLDVDPDERTEIQIDSLELYLCLLRNILCIPNSDSDPFLHDAAIIAFKEVKVMEVLVELSVNIYEESDKIQYLMSDIFYQYFKMEDAEAMTRSKNSETKSLCEDIKREKQQRRHKLKRVRHNKWGGISRVRMINGQSRVQSLTTNAMPNASMFDRRKLPRLRPMKEKKKRMYVSHKVPGALSYVADMFLDKAFTVLVNTMLSKLQNMPQFELAESNDAKKCFTLIALFLQYHRIKTRRVSAEAAKRDGVSFARLKWYSSSSISCVLNENIINFILKRIESLIESRGFKHMTVDPQRIERALMCYKEIIRCIYSMIEYGNSANRANGIKLFSFIFEDHRGPQLITDMIRDYKQHQNTKLYLSYCIETVHYTLNMIQKMERGGGDMRINTKKKKRKKRKRNTRPPQQQQEEQREEDGDEPMVHVAGMEIHDEEEPEQVDEDDAFEYGQATFDLESFMRAYAANKVVAHYMYILEDYATNSAKLNSYIVTLLDTLAFKMKHAPLLFQLSYFMTFSEILEDRMVARDKKQQVLIKFCKKVVAEFFARGSDNPVLFCEILFHKTPQALSDINTPGSVHRQQMERARKESERLERRNNIQGMEDGIHDDDFEDEEEYQELDMTEWSDAEDQLLRNYYATYSQQLNVLRILQDFIETELQITRSEVQIHMRLRVLGLRSGRMHSRKQKNAAKRRIKPQEMAIEMRKSIIYHCIHRWREDVNKSAFEWICGKLDGLCDVIEGFIDVSSNALLEDVAIVPVQFNEFGFMNNERLNDLLTKLEFLAPNAYTGTMWWRIPREFKTTEIRDMIRLMKEALELPCDADLRALCGTRDVDIAMLNDDNDNEAHNHLLADVEPMEGGPNENENEENENKEESGSEEEYEVQLQVMSPPVNESQNNEAETVDTTQEDEMDVETQNEAKKKKKKKKEKKKKKKDKKKRKKEKKKKKNKKKKDENKKKKKKSRKRKRDKMEKDDEEDALQNGEERIKRRRLNVNHNNNESEDEDNFFDDVDDEMDAQQTNQDMNTPQIQKFQSMELSENNNKLNVMDENEEEADEDVIHRKNRIKKSKRCFVSDSDSDSD